jgi:hypothetical protein
MYRIIMLAFASNKTAIGLLILIAASASFPSAYEPTNARGRRAEGTKAPSSQPTTAPADFMQFLHDKELSVHVWSYAPTQKEVILASKMQVAIGKNPEWWLAFVQQSEPGKPLPYHKDLGLTVEEYNEFLRLAHHRRMKITSNAVLHIRPLGRSKFEFLGDGAINQLTGIVIDLLSLKIQTPVGSCEHLDWRPKDPDRTFANQTWEGWSWKCESNEPNSLSSVSFLIAKWDGEDEWLIGYDESSRKEGEKPRTTRISITFDRP